MKDARNGPLYLDKPFLYRYESSLVIARAARAKAQSSIGTESSIARDGILCLDVTDESNSCCPNLT